MKSFPPQYDRPRFATTPKFLKRALFGGFRCQRIFPVAPSIAKTLASFVVM
jgi:hypothetical protein